MDRWWKDGWVGGEMMDGWLNGGCCSSSGQK